MCGTAIGSRLSRSASKTGCASPKRSNGIWTDPVQTYLTHLVDIREKGGGHLGVLATHVQEFAEKLKILLEDAGYETKIKSIPSPGNPK